MQCVSLHAQLIVLMAQREIQKFETRNILFVSIPFMMTKNNKKESINK